MLIVRIDDIHAFAHIVVVLRNSRYDANALRRPVFPRTDHVSIAHTAWQIDLGN